MAQDHRLIQSITKKLVVQLQHWDIKYVLYVSFLSVRLDFKLFKVRIFYIDWDS